MEIDELVREMLIGRYQRLSAANEIDDILESYIIQREIEDLREIANHLINTGFIVQSK